MNNFDDVYKEMIGTINSYTNQFKRKKAAWGLHNSKLRQKGSIDMSRIFSYKTSDNIFQKKTLQPKEKSHGIIILIDNSGSMTEDILTVVQRATELAIFAKRNNISFECYTFTSNTWYSNSNIIENFNVNGLCLVNLYNKTNSEKEIRDIFAEYYEYKTNKSSSKYNTKMRTNWGTGGTPLLTAYLAMVERAKIMKLSGIQHINVCVLTDGAATDELVYCGNTVTSFLDPFSQMIYELDTSIKVETDSQMDMLNRMLRDFDITTSHIFLTPSVGMYGKYTTHTDINEKLSKDGIYILNNILNFNKIFLINNYSINNKEKVRYMLTNSIVDTLCQYYLIENN